MKLFKNIIKKLMITTGILIVLFILAVVIFLYTSPQFGASISKEQQAVFTRSENYINGKFINLGHVEMQMDFKKTLQVLRKFIKAQPNGVPSSPLPIQETNASSLKNYVGPTRMIWFGHSTFLLQINGKNLLIDPMFGDVPAPLPFLGTSRFAEKLPIQIEDLPHIDAVILSHDHYDHLDYGSITRLKNKVDMFYTPLGVGSHLREWGVANEKIVELNWYEEVLQDDLKLICTPAQHFSGRGLTDRGATLWSSWIIKSETENIFFSGDSGYGPHFKTIGETYGPFDLAWIECGQYDPLWHEIHMMPEETAQAALDLNTEAVIPIHWGAFKLANHSWNEPVQRLMKSITDKNISLVIPVIGEHIHLSTLKPNINTWWQ